MDFYEAELLPEDKVNALEKILSKIPRNSKLVFAVNGINNFSVINRTDVGMAMGGLGYNAAIETADIVIVTDKPSKVAEAIKVARKTHQIVSTL